MAGSDNGESISSRRSIRRSEESSGLRDMGSKKPNNPIDHQNGLMYFFKLKEVATPAQFQH